MNLPLPLAARNTLGRPIHPAAENERGDHQRSNTHTHLPTKKRWKIYHSTVRRNNGAPQGKGGNLPSLDISPFARPVGSDPKLFPKA
jgi:hypothetical protein